MKNTLSSEDKALIQTCENLKDFLPKDSASNTVTKFIKTNIARLSAKVAHSQLY